MKSPLRVIEFTRRVWPVLSLTVILVVVAVCGSVGSVTVQRVVADAFIKVVIVVGLYIFVGNSGILSFGHASFMTIAAYLSAWLTMAPRLKQSILPDMWPFFAQIEVHVIPGSLLAGAAAAVFAFVIGTPLMRLSGLAASISTFALLAIIHTVYGNWDPMTFGQGALIGLPIYSDVWVTLVWAVLATAGAFLYQESRFGIALRASREDNVAARAAGIDVVRQRLIAFVLSAFFVGIGGVLQGHFLGTLWIADFYLGITFISVAMLVVGGMRSLAGAVLGPLSISALLEILRLLEVGIPVGSFKLAAPAGLRETGVAFLMVLILLLRPRGFTGGREVPWPWTRVAVNPRPSPLPTETS
jgi:branched-chain amino acid transport system permease protein